MNTDGSMQLRCDCGCSVLVIDYYRWPEGDEFFMEIYQTPGRETLKMRIRNAWKIMWGKEFVCGRAGMYTETDMEMLKTFLEGAKTNRTSS